MPISKPPAFQFYPGDFLSDIKVTRMNMEERGAYITLLSHHWLEGGLPIDEEELKDICKNPQNWDKIWERVGKCFFKKNNKLYNKRLLKEKQKQREWRKKSQEGGRKSAESRGGVVKPPLNDPLTKKEPPFNSSSSSSSSSSPSDIKIDSRESIVPDDKNPPKPDKPFFNFKLESWENISGKDLERWKNTYPACDIEQELLKIADWLVSNPSKRKSNYKRFISNWLSRQQERGGTKKTEQGKSATQTMIEKLKKEQDADN